MQLCAVARFPGATDGGSHRHGSGEQVRLAFTSEAGLAYLPFAAGRGPNRQTQNHNQNLFWHKIPGTAMTR